MGRSSDRENPSRGHARFFIIPQKKQNGFPARGRFMICQTYFEVFDGKTFFLKMTQKCPRVVGGHPRPIPSHFRPMLAKNRKPCNTNYYRSEGFTLTGYDIPGCVEDGAWMLWENSSVAAVAVAVAAVPSPP